MSKEKLVLEISLLLLLSLAGGFSGAGAEATVARNPSRSSPSLESFWSPALTNPAPLNVEVLGTNEVQGVAIERIRYTASSWQGQPHRVFALYAHPKGLGPFPAILQIQGGGQTCHPENVVYFVKHG